METIEFVLNMIEVAGIVVAIVFVPMLASAVTKWLRNKTNSDKLDQCIAELEYVTRRAVLTTTQTFVHELKAQGKFDEEAQKTAFNKTKHALLKMLSEEAYAALERNIGDVDTYIDNMIESIVYEDKQNAAA